MSSSKTSCIFRTRTTCSRSIICKNYRVRVMVFNATLYNIPVIWQSFLLVEETRVPEKKHRPVASHWQTLSHNGVSVHLEVIDTDCIGSYISNYHTITTTMAQKNYKEVRIRKIGQWLLTATEWVIDWLFLNTKWAIFTLYRGKSKLNFNEMMIMKRKWWSTICTKPTCLIDFL